MLHSLYFISLSKHHERKILSSLCFSVGSAVFYIRYYFCLTSDHQILKSDLFQKCICVYLSRHTVVPVLFFVLYTFRPTIRLWSLFNVGRQVYGCAYHDIVVGRWSELLMRLSYYVHSFGENLSQQGIEPVALWSCFAKPEH